MFRRFQRSYRSYSRPKFFRSRSRPRKPMGRPMGLIKGRRSRMYLKGKRYANKAMTSSIFGIVQPSKNIPANAIPAWAPLGVQANIPANNQSWGAWFGPSYLAGGANVANVDGNQNPTRIGDGLLQQVNRRCPDIGFNTFDYGAYYIDRAELARLWAVIHPNVAIADIFIKGFKITCMHHDNQLSQPFFLFYMKDAAHLGKYRQNLGKTKAYFRARKETLPGAIFRWQIPQVWFGGPVQSNWVLKFYYKEKRRTN